MADNGSDGNAVNTLAAEFVLRHVYLKDLSFESPNSPQVFGQKLEPIIRLSIGTWNQRVLTGEDWEVVLRMRANVTAGGRSWLIVEVHQAGIFQVSAQTDDHRKLILATRCPEALFPYARELVSSLCAKGGLPPLVFQPIDFDALDKQRRTKPAT